MELSLNQRVHGFVVADVQPLPEINGTAFILKHELSGAKLMHLANDDANKAFSITFRTPPQDDTGVFHILEHSVLCGSDKFPVKEPFVDLLKSSMQTFLNAMTFSDKTMYPVASTNEQDLFNLMDVYLDAVFHPAIYHKKAVFEQEGWHYELEEAEAQEGQDPTPKLVYNGVVFNEMKGALSDSSSVLYDELQKALFPDTAYAFESGGTPEGIPTLTYEGYLDEHRRHYQLSNSYTVLYGDLDIERALAWLDERYFTPVHEEELRNQEERRETGADPLLPRVIEAQAPVCNLGLTKAMRTAPENAVAGAGFVIGDAGQRTRVMATDILLDALFGSNEAPMKRAVLDSGIAEDVSAFVADAMKQPFVVIQLKKQQDETAADLVPTIEREITKLLDAGLSKDLIEAAISHEEFVMREHDFGLADGVAHAMNCLAGWLYDDSLATTYLRYEYDFRFLREALEGTYFDDLARSLFLQNNHRASVAVVPAQSDDDNALRTQLDALQASMSEADLNAIAEEVDVLREMQMAPDSDEAKATLPRLTTQDIGNAPAETPLDVVDDTPMRCLRHHIQTHGIAYAYRYFDATRVSFEELPYVSLLALVLGKLGTARHSAAEIDTLVQGKLGNLSFFTDLYERADDPAVTDLKFVVSSSALESNAAWLSTLPREIMHETDFTDTAKIRDLVAQNVIYLEQSFAGAGHSRAMARVRSYYSRAGLILEQLSNVDFYRFAKDLLKNWEEKSTDLPAILSGLAARLFADDACVISLTGSDEAIASFWAEDSRCCAGAFPAADAQKKLVVPAPVARNEAFIVPSDVTYSSVGYDRRLLNQPYTGAWAVASRALTYDFLWNEVRVKGGAYGVGFGATYSGNMRFYSYRDPHIDETIERFEQSAAYLRAFNPSKTEMDGFVVSSTAGFDTPKKARELARRQAGQYFAGIPTDQRGLTRSQIIETGVDTIRGLADAVQATADKKLVCVFGNKEIIESAKTPLEAIDLLG